MLSSLLRALPAAGLQHAQHLAAIGDDCLRLLPARSAKTRCMSGLRPERTVDLGWLSLVAASDAVAGARLPVNVSHFAAGGLTRCRLERRDRCWRSSGDPGRAAGIAVAECDRRADGEMMSSPPVPVTHPGRPAPPRPAKGAAAAGSCRGTTTGRPFFTRLVRADPPARC